MAQQPQAPPAADDTLTTVPASDTGLAGPIKYDARIIDNDVVNRITYLIGDAVVKYQDMTIEAGKITVDLNKRILIAEALPETLHVAADSLAGNGHADSVRVHMVGYPVFSDGNDQMRGERMEYNFSTGKGLVVRGRTDFEGGKYFGQQIKRASPKVLYVSRGIYTTCEYEDKPHYHFWARRMKIIVGERVIARPIVMFFGKIPVAFLPFGMFPTQKGRRSGLIVPRYGVSAREGRYLRELGYYWAASDYFDARATVDFYEKSGWLFKAGINYALRYNFTGGISGSLTRKNFASGQTERRWDLSIRHNQTLGKTASIRVNGTFVSDNSYYKDFSFNTNQRLTRRLISRGTFSKRWPKKRASLSLSLSEEKDLEDGSVTRLLPSIQLYLNERKLFGGGQESRGRRGSGSTRSEKWYENIYFRYNVTMQSRYSKTAVEPDSGIFITDRKSFANHDISLRMSGPTRLFGWLRLSQSLTIDEDWFDRARVYEDSTLEMNEEKGFFRRHTFSYNASANTTIYGLFNTRIGPIQAFRHVVTPSLSFSYRPDFSDPRWGYYVRVLDADSNVVIRDRFGGTPRGKLASMNLSIGNLFQMKLLRGQEEKKIDLFRMTISTGYNFAAREKKLRNISTSINAQPTRQINFSLSMSHSPYVFEQTSETSGQETSRYLWKEHGLFSGKWLRLTSLSISSNFRFQGKHESAAGESSERAGTAVENRFEEAPMMNYGIPWRIQFTFRYSISKFNPLKPTRRAYIDISQAEFKISKNWRVQFRGQFDLIKKQLTGQNWSIYRDLHCWEASFHWTPIGIGKGFYFRINIKAPQLQDIKFEKHGGRRSIFGGSYFY
ncbi:MAG: putative LPS assembly protein LptD [candidate division KSB1 bacterium]|nr:putative LPS assembly protein LptD [candidate division KSB1 bacterium]